MARPKDNDRPAYMWPDGDRGGWVVVNPTNGKKRRFTAAQEAQARETARLLNDYLEKQRQRDLLNAGKPRLNEVIDRWIREQLDLQPWDTSTRQTALLRLARIKRELGKDDALIQDIGVVELGRWLGKAAPKADPFNKWRQILVLVWGFAVVEGLANANEAEKVPRRSTSRKIVSNRKRRQPLDGAGYKNIYAQGDALLQLAMDISLVTTMSRNEVCGLRHDDYRDGYVYVIRDKTAADSERAFIRIRITPQLEEFQERARKLDNIACPFLLHRRPNRMQRRWTKNKPHWAYVNPDYLTRLFNEACAKVERFREMEPGQRPTYHEVRGLAARLAKAKGRDISKIRDLMAHADEKTTQIYLQGGRRALTDDVFVKCEAPFTVRELLEE